MRKLAGLSLLAVLALALWHSGSVFKAHLALIEMQRALQAPLAAGVRALKAQQPGAVMGLIGLGFLYGVLHAAGPGHGKLVLGGWAFSARARLLKIAGITLVASLAQALSAIVLVLVGAMLFGLGRNELTGLAEGPLLRLGEIALVVLGLLLMTRGGWRLWRTARPRYETPQAQGHPHDAECGCGHAHAPAPELVARASGAEAAMLIAGVALRPCTGAIFVMLLTVLIGAPLAGAAALLAMGFGTALVILAVALLSAKLGHGVFSEDQFRSLSRASDLAQFLVGALIVALYL